MGQLIRKGDRPIPYLLFLEITWRKVRNTLAIPLSNYTDEKPGILTLLFDTEWCLVEKQVLDQADWILPISIMSIKQFKTFKWVSVISLTWCGSCKWHFRIPSMYSRNEHDYLPQLLFPAFLFLQLQRLLFSKLSLLGSVNADEHKLFHWWQRNALAQV